MMCSLHRVDLLYLADGEEMVTRLLIGRGDWFE